MYDVDQNGVIELVEYLVALLFLIITKPKKSVENSSFCRTR